MNRNNAILPKSASKKLTVRMLAALVLAIAAGSSEDTREMLDDPDNELIIGQDMIHVSPYCR